MASLWFFCVSLHAITRICQIEIKKYLFTPVFIIKWISDFGRYVLLMKRIFTKPDRWNMFGRQYVAECNSLVIDSIGIIGIISLFIGAVCCIQMQMNLFSPLLPRYTIGFTTREILMLEFSSAMMCLILAGKIGSNIASEIGTMRVTEQIDAMEIMGINSANYLILPKVCAVVTLMPILVILSIALGLTGGGLLSWMTGAPTIDDYLYGIQQDVKMDHIIYAIKKSMVFGFIITTVSGFFGYTVKGGALQVGRNSTQAVVISSIMILMADVICTKLML